MDESTSEALNESNEPTAALNEDQVVAARAALKATGDAGASWFYWIAGLSLINSIILHVGGNSHFIVGLGITTLVDAVAAAISRQHPELAAIATSIGIGFTIFVTLISILCGWLSLRRLIVVFGLGIFFYLLDGLLYLLFEDYLSAGFHGYVLYMMIRGLMAYRQLQQLETAIMDAGDSFVAPEDDQDSGHHSFDS